MPVHNEVTDAVINELALFGIEGHLEDLGKHQAVVWEYKGRRRSLVCACTPSDYRSSLNQRAQCRRMLKADGVERPVADIYSINHALKLPQNPPKPSSSFERLVALEKNFDTLLDMMSELQGSMLDLQKKLAGARVTTTISFDEAPAVVEPEVVAEKPERKVNGRMHGGQRMAKVLAAMRPNAWTSVAEIREKSGGANAQIVAATLNYLKTKGKVESGRRGFWRIKPDYLREAVG